MRDKARIGFSVLWTAVLFTFFVLIREYFTVPAWKPFLAFLGLISLAAAAYVWIPRTIPGKWKKIWHEGIVYTCYGRLEDAFYGLVSDRMLFLHLWVVLTIFYVPAYLALFPGTFGYDAPVQIAQYFGEIELSSHHPLAHTFLMGFFFSFGEKVFHSYSTGFALYIALQGIAVTGAVAYSLMACKRHRVPLIWILAGALWAALNPFLQVLAFNSTKDILFGVFLLCFCVSVWDFLEEGVPGRGLYVRLVVFGVLTCLFRNQGIYILVVLLIMGLLLRLGKKGLYICIAIACLISQGFSVLAAEGLGIPRGDKSEMLCVPMQQAARVCFLYQEGEDVAVAPEDYAAVTEVIPAEGISMYLIDSADNVKSSFRTDVLMSDLGKYLSAYVSLGRQNPSEYLMAWDYMVCPYLNMSSNEYRVMAMNDTFSEMNHWGIDRAGYLEPFYDSLYEKICAQKIPLFLCPESCVWMLAALSGLAIARKRKGTLFAILPLGLYFGTILLGPVALARYLFPLTLSTPMLLGMLFQRKALTFMIDK